MAHPCTCRPGVLCTPCYRLMIAANLPLPRWHQDATVALPPAETSTQLQARIHEATRLMGGWHRFTVRRSDKAQVAAGFPDDLYLGHGRLVLIEYKMEAEKVTLPQQQWLETFWRHTRDTEIWVAWPSDEAALVAYLHNPAPQPRSEHWKTRLPAPFHAIL